MAEALAHVKRQFGRQAVILATRSRTRGGLFGIGAQPYVEITAARDLEDLPASLRTGAFAAPAVRQGNPTTAAGRPTSPSPIAQPPQADLLLSEMSALKSMVCQLVRGTHRDQAIGDSQALQDAYRELIENAVAEEIADELVASARSALADDQRDDPHSVRRALADAVGALVPVAGEIACGTAGRPRTIALVGPTGVGKTTTVAKLAANLALRQNRNVGMVTIDTYRIAAVEQLRTYAQIMDVPLEVATSPGQFREIIESMRDRDVILIDTAGRSQKDAVKIKELRVFFEAAKPDETHLVLASTCSERVMTDTVDRFSVLNPDRLIFTKLDEAVGFGVVLKCLQRARVRLSYVTMGQDVPDDIEIGSPKRLAGLIVGTGTNRPIMAGAQ